MSRKHIVEDFLATSVQINRTTGLSVDFGNCASFGLTGDCFDKPEDIWGEEEAIAKFREFVWRGLLGVPTSYQDWLEKELPAWKRDLGFKLVVHSLGLDLSNLLRYNRAVEIWKRIHWLMRVAPLSMELFVNGKTQAEVERLNKAVYGLKVCSCYEPWEIDLERVRALMLEVWIILHGEEKREKLTTVYYPRGNGNGGGASHETRSHTHTADGNRVLVVR